ncbi:adenosylmethionine decarboxylase [Geobacillus vulcani]|uniref:adenosylmethionine decarboxylase n=1 Tax=Geobacillus vulcani TaxID=135517 RepID=UPI0004DFACE2|nr:adenosylmethionine decarboxylase [Geobacillus vulcani]
MNIEGKHIIIDAFECDPARLNHIVHLEQLLAKAAQEAGMTVLYSYFHPFQPQGITGMLVLSTSHLSVHTWPEERYASFDFYTCGEHDPTDQVECLLKGIGAKRAVIYAVPRGRATPQLICGKEVNSFDPSPALHTQHGSAIARGDKWDQIGLKELLRHPHTSLFQEKSAFQHIHLIEATDVRMYLDEQLQFSSLDERIYHEALVHPIFTFAPNRERVLILGGGDGLALREVLKYDDVKHVDLVDLDPFVLHAAKHVKRLADLNQYSLHDRRVTIHPQNAVDFLASRPAPYPIIIIDFPDPTDPTTSDLYTTEFYTLLRDSLAEEGVFVCQSSSPEDTPIVFWSIGKTIESAGFQILSYHTIVPSFGDWGFHIGANASISWKHQRPPISCPTLPADLKTLLEFPPNILEKKKMAFVNSKQHSILHHVFHQEYA